ncbi:MAG: carboxylesterase/lipase family protein [Selenomonadaceae bacterium]|nr:carboxylesterase/lipase family protein [Selenomonadaceae bacterium]MBR6012578.1 carboxylesterase/lipase family protein [Selenomonadaceae bacterium]
MTTTVKTRYGTFNGFVDEKGVKTWLGIPFAQSPVGNLRWQAPQPLKASDKTFDAKKFGNDPMQSSMKLGNLADMLESQNIQSEDCLTLNIWKKSEKNNLPVMVWIYGGGFVCGSGNEPIYTKTDFMLSNDIIFVTINYRLNVFGFMNFAEIDKNFEDSGYLGIKDQIAALKWIHENIAEFGGNPENITVFGESAGSMSTFFLTIAPKEKNLFQKVIPQSGAVGFYRTPEDSTKVAKNFMEFCGAKTVGDLMKKSAVELQKFYAEFISTREMNVADFYPTCDGKFLPKNPFKALKDGAARGIKILTGTTSDEWRAFLLANENLFELMRKDPQDISPIFSRETKYNNEEIYKKWLKNRPDTEDTYGDFVTQLDWRVGQELAAEYQSAFDDVYYYLFTQQPSPPLEYLGAFHALDLSYTFNVPYLEPNPNQKLVKVIQASWAAFAATGNPDNEFIPHWKKYSAENRQTMELNSKGCVLHKDLNTENLNALRYVYED